ncbi:MAG TPA: hypothetical protein VMT17_11880 [Anaeromyxobacteraceae bacterium]|nr:hypothetical protein [Anaeromyxobacteraceae bacterium]
MGGIPGATAPAWLREGAAEARPPTSGERPDLLLGIVQEDGASLTVEVLNGRVGQQALLYVNQRGLFAIVARLHRQALGAKVYLRLRAWSPALQWSV